MKNMPKEGELYVGLDIGTTKVVALVGLVNASGSVDVIGVGSCPSRGLRKGIVINIESTVQSIKNAIRDAELMAGCEIHSVYTGIAGSHIKSVNSHGIVAIRDHEVSKLDVERVVDAAKAVIIPAGHKILHVLPQEFIVDGQEGVKEPIGMFGIRLEAMVHIVTGSISAVQNIIKCVERCNLKTSDVILQPLASSQAVLSEDDKDLGVCLIDIGGGTTDVAVFINGSMYFSTIIPLAGDQVTNDISVAFRISSKMAEELKLQHATLVEKVDSASHKIVIDDQGGRRAQEITEGALREVVKARYLELFSLVLSELKSNRVFDLISTNIVLTGGGSKIEGIVDLAEQIFELPVKIGVPEKIGGMVDVMNNPIYSTGVGLLLTAMQCSRDGIEDSEDYSLLDRPKSLWEKMKAWFKANF